VRYSLRSDKAQATGVWSETQLFYALAAPMKVHRQMIRSSLARSIFLENKCSDHFSFDGRLDLTHLFSKKMSPLFLSPNKLCFQMASKGVALVLQVVENVMLSTAIRQKVRFPYGLELKIPKWSTFDTGSTPVGNRKLYWFESSPGQNHLGSMFQFFALYLPLFLMTTLRTPKVLHKKWVRSNQDF
jgi:hypothetical protein